MNIPEAKAMIVEYSWGTYYETASKIWIVATGAQGD